MAERLTAHELTEFAQVFPPGPALNSLLREAGIPADHLPVFYGLDSREYWSLVNDRIAGGMIEDGRGVLLRFARGRYPANSVFAEAAPAVLRRVCFVGASPDDMPRPRVGRELRAVLDALRDGGGEGAEPADVAMLPAATAADLGRLAGARPDLLHLACHGDGDALIFEDRDGEARPVPIAEVAETLRVLTAAAGGMLGGVVLSACRGEAAARALLPYARTVVAHRGDLDVDDAAAFAGHLYRTLRQGAALGAAAEVAAQLVAVGDHGRPWVRDGLIVLDHETEAGNR